MTKVLLSGYYGYDNFGDEAILSVLVKCLKNIGSDITVLTQNTEKTAQQHNVKTIYRFSIFKIIKEMQNTDILISGGGSLLQDTTSIRSILYYLFIIFMGNLICKKTIIFAQGIGPINNKLARMLTKYILKQTDLVTVRDSKSQELLTTWGIPSILVDDPVWGIEVETSIPRNKIGIQLREWKFMTDEFLIKLVRKIAHDFADKEIYIYSLQDKQDLDIAMRFENYLHLENPKVRTKVFHDMSIEEMISNMKDLEYFIAMRYHAIMIGIKYGIKTLAINYAPKVEALANFAMIPSVKPNEDREIDNAIIKMQSLSRQSLISTKDKKRFSFEIFEKEITS